MTVLMIIGSLFAGYWTGRAGPRWPITTGCAAFAAGLLIASPLITQHPDYVALSLALALAGVGIGITVVPVTAAVLDAVPPERSGMAASAANTSREIGAVAGTSVLGALVFSRLNSTLNSHIDALHVSASNKAAILAFKPLIIKVIETGQIDKYLKAVLKPGRPHRRGRGGRLRGVRRRPARGVLPVGRARHPRRPARRVHAG